MIANRLRSSARSLAPSGASPTPPQAAKKAGQKKAAQKKAAQKKAAQKKAAEPGKQPDGTTPGSPTAAERRAAQRRRARRAKGVNGVVEQFNRRYIVGWVSVPVDSKPTVVTLRIGSTALVRTTATAGKTDRKTGQQIRHFTIQVRGLWDYLQHNDRLTVRVRGERLPIVGHGMFRKAGRDGEHNLDELRDLIEHGHLISQKGRLELDKRLDTRWQGRVRDLYGIASTVVRERFGYDLFVIYGTLLGSVRDGGVISHDVDFDTAYLSRHSDGPAAAEEAVDMAFALIEAGLIVEARDRVLHVHHPDDPEYRIDIFHTFADADGLLRFPWGVAGRGDLPVAAFQDLRETTFEGGRVKVPVRAEEVLAHLYGDDWREPKPGWHWGAERSDYAADGLIDLKQRNRVYWSNFYARTEYTSGSTFFEYVADLPDTPGRIIELGCGDGRDGCSFGRTGRRVLGLDQSPVGVEHAQQHAEALGLSEQVRFRVCDVTDPQALGPMIQAELTASPDPALFYLRFFLHAIDQEAQDRLLYTLAAYARPGDRFAAEFRSSADEKLPKVHDDHYRRFQTAAELAAKLAAHGFEVTYAEESAGLSPYRGEDPVLARVLAVYRGGDGGGDGIDQRSDEQASDQSGDPSDEQTSGQSGDPSDEQASDQSGEQASDQPAPADQPSPSPAGTGM